MSAIHAAIGMVNARFESMARQQQTKQFMDELRRQAEMERIWGVAAGIYTLQQFKASQEQPAALTTACRSCGAGEVMVHHGNRLCAYCRMPR